MGVLRIVWGYARWLYVEETAWNRVSRDAQYTVQCGGVGIVVWECIAHSRLGQKKKKSQFCQYIFQI